MHMTGSQATVQLVQQGESFMETDILVKQFNWYNQAAGITEKLVQQFTWYITLV